MELIEGTIKGIFENYPPIFKAILLLKKNKLLKNTRIKKITNKTLIINALDYTTFRVLTYNKEKILKYIKKTLKDCVCNVEIENIQILNSPEISYSKRTKKNIPLLEKIKQVREKLYGYK